MMVVRVFGRNAALPEGKRVEDVEGRYWYLAPAPGSDLAAVGAYLRSTWLPEEDGGPVGQEFGLEVCDPFREGWIILFDPESWFLPQGFDRWLEGLKAAVPGLEASFRPVKVGTPVYRPLWDAPMPIALGAPGWWVAAVAWSRLRLRYADVTLPDDPQAAQRFLDWVGELGPVMMLRNGIEQPLGEDGAATLVGLQAENEDGRLYPAVRGRHERRMLYLKMGHAVSLVASSAEPGGENLRECYRRIVDVLRGTGPNYDRVIVVVGMAPHGAWLRKVFERWTVSPMDARMLGGDWTEQWRDHPIVVLAHGTPPDWGCPDETTDEWTESQLSEHLTLWERADPDPWFTVDGPLGPDAPPLPPLPPGYQHLAARLGYPT